MADKVSGTGLVLECSGLRKAFGDLVAVDGVGFTIAEGETYGLLGPNGAGKTTSIKMLLGLAKPTSGEARLLGKPIGDPQSRSRVGFLPEHFRFQDWLTACAHAAYTGGTYDARGYRFHKHTTFIKVHWNLLSQEEGTVVADGFVEPFNPGDGLNAVRLKLVGLDEKDNVVSSAEGMPKDEYIESPFYPASPFRLAMKLTSKEKVITMTGYYYHYKLDMRPRLSGRQLDNIPLTSDLPH